jgi:TPR repeat protein
LLLVWFAVPCGFRPVFAQTAATPDGDGAGLADDAAFAQLLRQTAQQISDGHIVVPAEDCAVATWSRVLQHHAAAPDSAAIRQDLLEFATLARSRADSEKAAGRVSVAVDFTVFADLASQLLTHRPDAAPPETLAAPAPPPAVAAAPRPEAPPAASVPPAVASVPAAPAPPNRADRAAAEFYRKRGDEMLANRDISAARKFYEFAANAGSGRAARALARTLDPDVLSQLGVVGAKPDPDLARFWYGRAASLGEPEADTKLQALGTAAGK